MKRTHRQTVKIGPGGTFEGRVPEATEGTTAEVIVLLPATSPSLNGLNPADRKAIIERTRALSDKAITDGMETRSIDRVNAEIAYRRAGGYWPDEFDPSEIK